MTKCIPLFKRTQSKYTYLKTMNAVYRCEQSKYKKLRDTLSNKNYDLFLLFFLLLKSQRLVCMNFTANLAWKNDLHKKLWGGELFWTEKVEALTWIKPFAMVKIITKFVRQVAMCAIIQCVNNHDMFQIYEYWIQYMSEWISSFEIMIHVSLPDLRRNIRNYALALFK